MAYVLVTQGLSKRYKDFKALDNLSMRVPKGSIYGLVGRNGAGKTTLIRLICGLQAPTSGTYALYGVDSGQKDIGKVRRRMGAVVETPSIYLELTAEDNLKEQFRVLGVPSDGGIPELLRLVGLEDTGRKKARNFSLGMKQRLGIAVALAGEPDFLVLDEPVNGLDPQGIIEIRELILKLNRERRITVLISSHILDELSRLATHYGFIDSGRMVKELSARELEAACRKCLRVEVTDTRALVRVLDQMGVEYKILGDGQADVFAQVNISRLSRALDGEGCELLSAQERDESLESYFVNLVRVVPMIKLLSANLLRLWKNNAFWGSMGVSLGMGVFMVVDSWRSAQESGGAWASTMDAELFKYAAFIGILAAELIPLFFGTEYSDGDLEVTLVSDGTITLSNAAGERLFSSGPFELKICPSLPHFHTNISTYPDLRTGNVSAAKTAPPDPDKLAGLGGSSGAVFVLREASYRFANTSAPPSRSPSRASLQWDSLWGW